MLVFSRIDIEAQLIGGIPMFVVEFAEKFLLVFFIYAFKLFYKLITY